MSFIALKQNPFTGLGEQWTGAERRAAQAADRAAAGAAEVFAEATRKRAGLFDRWDDDMVSQVRAHRDRSGHWGVGLPDADEDVQQRAMEAEYGDGVHKPQPLFRTTERRAMDEAQATFSEILREGLFG